MFSRKIYFLMKNILYANILDPVNPDIGKCLLGVFHTF